MTQVCIVAKVTSDYWLMAMKVIVAGEDNQPYSVYSVCPLSVVALYVNAVSARTSFSGSVTGIAGGGDDKHCISVSLYKNGRKKVPCTCYR